jgi:hypothetical protein
MTGCCDEVTVQMMSAFLAASWGVFSMLTANENLFDIFSASSAE